MNETDFLHNFLILNKTELHSCRRARMAKCTKPRSTLRRNTYMEYSHNIHRLYCCLHRTPNCCTILFYYDIYVFKFYNYKSVVFYILILKIIIRILYLQMKHSNYLRNVNQNIIQLQIIVRRLTKDQNSPPHNNAKVGKDNQRAKIFREPVREEIDKCFKNEKNLLSS